MILGFDIGTKRTGVALSVGKMAVEHTTLLSVGEALIADIISLCETERAEMIVVGLPLNSDGSESAQTEFVLGVVAQIEATTSLPVLLEDEFLTTNEAYRLMEAAGVSRQEAESRIDQFSAALILQQYLNQIEERQDGVDA